MDEKDKKQTEEQKIIEIYKIYRKFSGRFEKDQKSADENLEDKISRVNPYYTKNQDLSYAGE